MPIHEKHKLCTSKIWYILYGSSVSLCLIITMPFYILRVLKSCPKLAFFDVSFCSKVDNELLSDLKVAFPHVTFKKSFSD